MMKLARLVLSWNLSNKAPLVGNATGARDTAWLRPFASWADVPASRRDLADKGTHVDRIFAPYAVFKGKAALSVEPVLPTFTKVDSGGLRIGRRGVMMMTFMPAVGERKYDWEKRQKFALSATEVGSLINLGANDSSEFFHDPSMQSSNAGQVRKSLSVKPHGDGTGYFISLSVSNNILKTTERFTVPVTAAEFAVMKSAFNFALPHIMGWDRVTRQVPGAVERNILKADPQALQSEWDR